MTITEIFASIQGESSYGGRPCVFIRLTGCNLRCIYCDTAYAYEGGRELSADEIVAAVRAYGIPLVEITGGEPLLQEETLPLVRQLIDEGFTVLIETNGSVSIREVDRRAVVIMDIKTPKSGMFDKMELDNLALLKPSDELKFVVADREDYEWTREFIRNRRLAGVCTLLLSPGFGTLAPRDLAQWIVADRLPVRLNLQLHKYVFGPEEQGV